MAQPQQNAVNFGGQSYDLTRGADLNALFAAMGATITHQHQTITQLQTNPPPNPQIQQLVNALTPAAPRVGGVTNPVLSTPQNNVDYEEHHVPTGIEDIKSFEVPSPFTGAHTDAHNFMIRLQAYFSAKPKAMRFTKNRILLTVQLLKKAISRHWAELVERSVSQGVNDSNYFDNWDAFKAEFLKRYGLPNPKQFYLREMMKFRQHPKLGCKRYADEFERLRIESGTDKDTAFFHLKQGTYRPYREQLILMHNPRRDTYDSWVEGLEQLQSDIDQSREFAYGDSTAAYARRPFQGQSAAHQRPAQASQDNYGDPMHVDAINPPKGKRQQPRRGIPKPASRPPPQKKKTSNRLPPHPTAASSSKSKPKPTRLDDPDFRCFICDGKGHYSRDCNANPKTIGMQRIQQLGMMVESAMDLKSQLGYEDEEEYEEEEEFVDEEDYDQNDDLISFQDEDPAHPNEVHVDTTGFLDF